MEYIVQRKLLIKIKLKFRRQTREPKDVKNAINLVINCNKLIFAWVSWIIIIFFFFVNKNTENNLSSS